MANKVVADLGNGLELWLVDCSSLKEQDVNAQVMDKRRMKILTSNIAKRGQLESLPYVYKDGEQLYIVSGHHRVRAAVAAGLKQIYVLVETTHLTKSQIISKQISHNELVGSADSEILGQLVSQMESVDDLISSGLSEEWLNDIKGDATAIEVPNLDFDWRKVEITFLPAQMEDFKTLCASIDNKSEMVGVVSKDLYTKFSNAMVDYGRKNNIKSIGAVISKLVEVALRDLEEVND